VSADRSPDRAMQEIVKRPHYRATSRVIASTIAAEPNAEDFQQARVILAALLRHGYKVVPLTDVRATR